jgi:hypothetical protein
MLSSVLYIAYIFSDLNQAIDREKLELLINDIKDTPPQEEALIMMYNKVHDNALEKSTWNHFWKLVQEKPTKCPCFDAARSTYINTMHRLKENDYVISAQLEKKVTQRECLNYLFSNYNYSYNNTGVEEASLFYFQKTIGQLTEQEMIGLIIMQENVSLYNPKRFRDRFDKKVSEVQQRIN